MQDSYEVEEAVQKVKDGMHGTISEAELAQVHDIVVTEHLEPVVGLQGKYRFKSVKEDQSLDVMGVSDRNLL